MQTPVLDTTICFQQPCFPFATSLSTRLVRVLVGVGGWVGGCVCMCGDGLLVVAVVTLHKHTPQFPLQYIHTPHFPL